MMANGLEEHPFFKSAPEPEQKPAPIEERLNRELPVPPTWKETAKDVGRSAVSGFSKGIAGTFGGGAGSLETFAVRDIPQLLYSGAARLGEATDILSPVEAEKLAEPTQYADPAVQAGYKAPFTGRRTYKYVTEKGYPEWMKETIESPETSPAMKQAAEALTYKPKTGPGEVTQAGAEMAAQGVPGALRTMPGRLMTGFGAGAGAEFMAKSSPDEQSESYNRLLGAIGGSLGGAYASSLAGRLYSSARALVAPQTTGMDQLMRAVATDISRGHSSLTPEQIKEFIDRGVDVSILDLAGPETRDLIGKMAGRSAAMTEDAARYNEMIKTRGAESGQRVSTALRGMYDYPVDAAQMTDLLKEAGKRTRDDVYTKLNAKDIIVNESEFADLLNRPTMKRAMKEAEETMADFPQYEIRPPKTIPGQPGEPSRWVNTEKGLVEEGGRAAVPARQESGNLAYWDMVKQKLDDILETATPGTTEHRAALDAKRNLLKVLDNIEGYADARGKAWETFKASSAPEAGYNFFNPKGGFGEFTERNLKKVFDGLNDNQKELFSLGFASKINELIRNGNIDTVAKQFTKPAFRDRALIALGPERFAELKGLVLSENLISKAKSIPLRTQAEMAPSTAGVIGGGAAGLLDFLTFGVSPQTAVAAIAGGEAVRKGKIFLSNMERKMAEKVVPLALSTDPADVKRLGEMAMKSPFIDDLLNKLTTAATAIETQRSKEKPPKKEADGGRIGRKAGGRIGHHYEAARLVKAAELAKKNHGKQTETILNAPDEHVVKALSVANRSIEG